MINREKLSVRLKLEIENGKMLHRAGLKKALELVEGLDEDEVVEPELLLLEVYRNLKESEDCELEVRCDMFKDGSGSWVALESDYSPYMVSLDFSGDGTKLENVQVFKKTKTVVEDEKKVF
jgi:hypothetical protein